jgi:hypothetical protein
MVVWSWGVPSGAPFKDGSPAATSLIIKSAARQRKDFADATRHPEKNPRLCEPRGPRFSDEVVAAVGGDAA